ncbi:MAG: TrmB family transcriptional regulator [Nitrosopumilus sp.]
MALVGAKQTIGSEYGSISNSIKLILKKFGMTENELKVYHHLIKNGPQHANNVGKELKIYRTETYRLLKSLQQKGMVNIIFDKPSKFAAIDYAKALDHLINTQISRLNELRLVRDSLLK